MGDPRGARLLHGFRDAFLRLRQRLDRAVFVEEELVDADGTAQALSLLAVAVERAVVVEEEGAALEVDHAGVDGEAVLRRAGGLSAERPGTGDLFGGGVVDALAAATAETGVDVVVEAVALIEPRTFDVILELQVDDETSPLTPCVVTGWKNMNANVVVSKGDKISIKAKFKKVEK